MTLADRVLVQGLECAAGRQPSLRERRARFAAHGRELGIERYELIDGRRRRAANFLLRQARGTGPAVDAVEIIRFSPQASSPAEHGPLWTRVASCAADGFDTARSFLLVGARRQQLPSGGRGMRLLWFGRGLASLTAEQFAQHYTGVHGPLVAGHASVLGMRSYMQVASDCPEEEETLRGLGLGTAEAPPVFADIVMGTPAKPIRGAAQRRVANEEVAADEKRHIDFGRSMMLLA